MSVNLTDFLVIGDIYIIDNQTTSPEAIKPSQDIPNAIKTIKQFKDQVKQTVTTTVSPGAIHRPTAGELMAKEEPEIKRQADNAVKETLDKIPELQEAKKTLEGLR